MRFPVFLLLLFVLSANVVAQQLPSTYKGLAEYIETTDIDSVQVERIDARLRVLDGVGRDSLKTQVFPALEEAYKNKEAREKAFLMSVLTVSAYQILGDISLTQIYIDREIKHRQAIGLNFSLMMAYSRKMFILADADSTTLAMSTALKLKDQMAQAELDSWQEGVLLQMFCVFFHRIYERDYALEACKRAYALKTEYDQQGQGQVLETLALLMETDPDSVHKALDYRRRAIQMMIAEGDSFSMRVSYRNMARYFMKTGQPDSVMYYFEKTFNLYDKFPFFNGWFMDQVEYASFLIGQNDMLAAKQVLDTLGYFGQDQLTRENTIKLYQLREQYYAKQGDFERFLIWNSRSDSLLLAKYDVESKAELAELKVLYETEKKEIENARLKEKNKASRTQLFILLVLLILVLVVVVLIVGRRRRDEKIHEQKQKLLQLNLEKSKLEQQQLKRRNKDLLRDIQNYVKQVVEQQSVNTEVLELVEELRDAEHAPIVQKKTAQIKTRLNEQVNREAFREIMSRMEEVYPLFYAQLKTKIGPEKESELLVTAMYFLGYETKSIASVLNRTEKAIRSIRYRVRKKLNMSDSDDFLDFLKAEQHQLSGVNIS